MRITQSSFLILIAANSSFAPSFAQETPNSVKDLAACRSISSDSERLACYDRTAAALDSSLKSKEIVLIEREEVRRTKRGLFGFLLPEKSVFGDTGDPEQNQLTTKITSVRPYGEFVAIGVESGGIWQSTEYLPSTPKVGSSITIKKGALGSYFLRFERGPSVRGKRIQ